MSLEDHRKEIAEIDKKIIKLIDGRVTVSKKVFEAKRSEGRKISDPEQEKLVLGRAMDLATELGLDAGAIREIFRILIKMSLQKQNELLGRNQG
ncbi:MAG: chorismate mutase [Methanotrichaceae archaeon]|nr:chorismate mutase [Methanotrichaceae archaeon]